MIETYRHQPLDNGRKQIRLLQITNFDPDAIGITLKHFDIETCPPFKALSYTWGPSKPDCDMIISIDGSRFTIRENLGRFFCAMCSILRKRVFDSHREPYLVDVDLRPEYFWIDQICIQQSDSNERNHQVKIMGNIFSVAEEVLVWLGVFKIKGKSPNQLVSELSRRPYWRRLWIIQEIMLGKMVTLFYNTELLDWNDFFLHKNPGWSLALQLDYADARSRSRGRLRGRYRSRSQVPDQRISQAPIIANSQPEKLPGIVESILDERHKFTSSGRGRSLSYVLELFVLSGAQCENPRDKVYGLLGLIEDSAAVAVDYEKSVEDVYYEVIGKIIHDEIYLSQGSVTLFALLLMRKMGLEEKLKNSFEQHVVGIKKQQDAEWGLVLRAHQEKASKLVQEAKERFYKEMGSERHVHSAAEQSAKTVVEKVHARMEALFRNYNEEEEPRWLVERELARYTMSYPAGIFWEHVLKEVYPSSSVEDLLEKLSSLGVRLPLFGRKAIPVG